MELSKTYVGRNDMKLEYEVILDELKYMFNGFIEVSNSMEGVNSEVALNLSDIEGILKKVMHDTYSLILLAEEDKQYIQVENYKWSMIPYPSIISLTRCIFEAYLIFNYIFISTRGDGDELNYRYTLWKLDEFKTRQNFSVFRDESKAKLESEKSVIEGLYEDLYSNPKYKSLPKNRKKKFKKKSFSWHPEWTLLATMAGISEKYWKNNYAFMSHYTHSGYISTFQIRQIHSNEQAKSQCLSFLQLVTIVLARFISEYSGFHENVESALKSDTKLFNQVYFWVDLSKGLNEFFNENK